ncbi:hypothetical protein GGTG_05279 [Gaeumannomyces tritici R3-111a-1]|uniref:Zn(2)-C6 fungal-type domain-containing protein n=1 Tax=Gaeumannomyces tritici (strain R3-111a-1) TaxID=644352 RepID=J3NVG4_GAET3|nr:hypothetical protein GGTG_05279 [Gaeumannomyces tritici R3-111a-1]EJT75342.1 hypothetical protein GGTG_05279 [Gaeumannomyces tritici R3-111a-1]
MAPPSFPPPAAVPTTASSTATTTATEDGGLFVGASGSPVAPSVPATSAPETSSAPPIRQQPPPPPPPDLQDVPASRASAEQQQLPSPTASIHQHGGLKYEPPAGVSSAIASAHNTLQVLEAVASTSSAPPSAPVLPDAASLQQQQHESHQQHQHHYPVLAPSPHGLEEQHHQQQQQQRLQYSASAAVAHHDQNGNPHGYDHHMQYSPPAASPTTPGGNVPQSGAAMHPHVKQTRLRRACDMCSARKVKCDEAGPPCKPCRSLNVECTYTREMKRRGPPNKHAEAARAKRTRMEAAVGAAPGWNNAAEMSTSISSGTGLGGQTRQQSHEQAPQGTQPQIQQGPSPPLDAESIAPWPTLALLVDDFYTYIHPLIPFPHEPSFRRSFAAREDKTDPEFLALLASMIATLVASFPRAARLHLKSQRNASLFPRAIALIERCRAVAMMARGPMFAGKESMSVNDAATSYFLGLASAYIMQWKMCRRFLAECLCFAQELGLHRCRHLDPVLGPGGLEYGSPDQSVDHIKDQIGKRIFWVMLVGVRSLVQLGATHSELPLPPPTPAEPYPDLPLEVDDEYITSSEILPQPAGRVSLLTGFNQGIKIYMTMNPIVSVELSYGINSLSLEDQEEMLMSCLHAAKHATDDLPPELKLNIDPVPSGLDANNGTAPGHAGSLLALPLAEAFADAPGFQYFPPAYPNSQPANDVRRVIENQPERRRLLQFEIQKANIYGSQLATRSYYVERCFNLRDAHRARVASYTGMARSDPAQADQRASMEDLDRRLARADGGASTDPWASERELIVQNLLIVLASIPQRSMEPNGGSIINKIRQVASTLLADAPERKGPVAVRSEEMLRHFVDILLRLEKTGGPGRGSGPAVAAAAAAGIANGTSSGFDSGLDAGGVMTPMDEEEELRTWADLRETQMRFAQNGGFMANP